MPEMHHADCFEWLRARTANSITAVCTDPPYGVLEFTEKEVRKLRSGRGGVWRLPPTIGGSKRDPLPRFTVLTPQQKTSLRQFFKDWGMALHPALVPGAHVCVAGNPALQHLVQAAMAEAGYEVRATIVRLYYSFRGGDRPKNAETEFPEVCVTPKGAYEPWMLFRKPISEKTVAMNLRKWGTGGLRRLNADKPLPDVIASSRTPDREEAISDHPCLKPQHFMRIITRALLPLGEGLVADPFMGSGSTIAAAQALGYRSVGIEIDAGYFALAKQAVPRLAALYPDFDGSSLDQVTDDTYRAAVDVRDQLAFVLEEPPAAHSAPRAQKPRKKAG